MGKKLYVGSLPYSTTEQDLQDLFASVGPVESAKIVTDRDSGRSKGFGFVEMVNDQDATNAIQQLNGKDLGGRKLIVNEAKPQAPRTGGRDGGGGRGGFGGGGGRGGRNNYRG